MPDSPRDIDIVATQQLTTQSQSIDSSLHHSMATLEVTKRSTTMGLPTPSTPPADDFDQTSPAMLARLPVGLSTPVSPAFGSFHATEACSTQDDQLLYPDYHKASSNDGPLFDTASHRSPSPSIQRNFEPIAAVPVQPKSKHSSPDSRTYLRTIPDDVVGVLQIYNHDPVGYARYIAEQNDRHRAMRRERAMHDSRFASQKALPLPTISAAATTRDAHTMQQLEMLTKAPRVKKGKSYSCPSMTGPIIGMPPGSPDGPPLRDEMRYSSPPEVSRPFAPQKRTRDQATVENAAPSSSPPKRRRVPVLPGVPVNTAATQAHSAKRRRRLSSAAPGSPEAYSSPTTASGKPKTHTRAQASKKVDDDLKDSEWMKLADYCPDIASLDAPGARKLRVSWGTSDPLDLSNDADEKFLHPQEIQLAATLRFHCNQYLINKRRIFKAKVKALQEGKAFNKTACQQCTAMDVNKASKLWAAFDEVGWFDEHWFQKFV